ncbi:MAG: ABC transporter permease [Ndongobacter sp.]|nr:ABC transporter permease [Ndongobacter sp.]
MKNPLIKRIPKELRSEWHKYLVIIIFMVVMIGVVSGMYAGHDGMLEAIAAGREELKIEDGSFELTKKASPELLAAIASGKRADVRQYFIDEGLREADEEVAKAIQEELDASVRSGIERLVREQCAMYEITDETAIARQIDAAIDEKYDAAIAEARQSEEYLKATEDAYEKAHHAVIEAVDEKWDEISGQYDLTGAFKAQPVTVIENFYRNESEDHDNDGEKDAVIRLFKSDASVNRASFLEGRAPEGANEIAVDRMHADNIGISVGDGITVGGRKFEVVGLLSYVNYLTLHESNTDLMFDSFGFDVGMVTPEAFEALSSRLHYNYAYFYDAKPADKIAKADYADYFLKMLLTQTLVHENKIENFVPEYVRQASNFAPSDIDSDTTGTTIMCYILIAVIAFIFSITISNTIEKEASVIGTLRASGYTKRELIVHYMTMPVIVTLAGAVLGNIVGYTAFKEVAVKLYYNSYSLPACATTFSYKGFVMTTILPLALMFFINLFVIVRRLQFSPLNFLRNDLRKTRPSRACRLPGWSFMRRFRLRVILQNMSNYAVLIFGVIFIELMLCFAFGMPDSLEHYRRCAPDMMFADYQYMLMSDKNEDGALIVTGEPTAERFSSTSLKYAKDTYSFLEGIGSGGDESVTVYGIVENSAYIDLPDDIKTGEVFISSAFRDKFNLRQGDQIILKEEYENKTYTLTVKGVTRYDGGIAVFMTNDSFNTMFDRDRDAFNGFLSKEEIIDVEERYIATVVTQEEITKITNQMMHSVGQFLAIFKIAMVVLSAALIYLLAKIIIERNEKSISMAKILGFTNGEIRSLYILPTAIVVAVFAVIGFVVGYFLMVWIFKLFIMQMDGYFAFYMSYGSMALSVVYLLIGYAFVSIIDFIRIKKIAMDEALKNADR